MHRLKLSMALLAGSCAMALSSSANASTVTYDFDLGNSGGATAVLTLDNITTTDGLMLTTTADFVSFVVTDINNGTNYGKFTLTPSNVTGFTFKTDTAGSSTPGKINSFNISVDDTDGNNGTTPFLIVLNDNEWQIREKDNDPVAGASGTLTLTSGPNLVVTGNSSATPLPSTWPLFVGGLGLFGFLTRRKKRAQALTAA